MSDDYIASTGDLRGDEWDPVAEAAFHAWRTAGDMPVRERWALVVMATLAEQSRQGESADDVIEAAADWSDYRKEYGLPQAHYDVAFRAFMAGWKAGHYGEQSSVLS